MSIATTRTPARQAGSRAASQAPASALARPSTCPSRPCTPSRSTNPVCHRSAATVAVPVSGSTPKRGRPRRVSSMPSAVTGSGWAGRSMVASRANAADTVGQDSPWSRPAWVIVRPPTPTARPAAVFSRAVTRARGGSCGADSVNEPRPQLGVRQRHRRLRHTSRDLTGPVTSRGRVTAQPRGALEGVRHAGHTASTSAAVTRCTTRHPSIGSSSTRSTTTPSNPSNNVVSSCTPALFMIDCFSNGHDHEEPRAPSHRGGPGQANPVTQRHP
jgi:hypothetical protein